MKTPQIGERWRWIYKLRNDYSDLIVEITSLKKAPIFLTKIVQVIQSNFVGDKKGSPSSMYMDCSINDDMFIYLSGQDNPNV